ncbi:MAG: PEP-CTERM sorting domain-containing protein [Phycisphaeraceae bacterium]
MKSYAIAVSAALLGVCASVGADTLSLSIGIRETLGDGPVFSDGGASGGIEHVNRDGQDLTLDGTWQLFTFTPAVDELTAFAGTTANSVLDTDWGVLEHIRIRNTDNLTVPIRLLIDDVTNHTPLGSVVEDFESFNIGDEVLFHEPTFSGSTLLYVEPFGSSAVTDADSYAGDHAYAVDFQFVADPNGWIRLTSFAATNLPNPEIQLRNLAGGQQPSISFWASAVVIPEPSSALLLGAAALGLCIRRRYR